MSVQTDFLIIGGGIAGLTAAIALEQIGRSYLLVERQAFIKGIGAGFGITSNAIESFRQLGLAEEVEAIANPLSNLKIVDQYGKQILDGNPQSLKGYNKTNYAIHRADLHALLVSKIRPENILTDKKYAHFACTNEGIIAHFEGEKQIHCKYLLGADGIGSFVRQQLFENTSPRYAGYTCWRGVIDKGEIALKSSIETWGSNGRFGVTPLINNQIYWYACINAPANSATHKAYQLSDLQEIFKDYHDIIPQVLRKTKASDLIHNDIIDLEPLAQYHAGNILLLGDAAHATTPNLGQGACMAIEDVAILKQELLATKNVAEAFANTTQRRLKRCKTIVDKSWMMGKVAQMDNEWLIPLRNQCLRLVPQAIQDRQMRDLLDTRFLER